MPRKSSARPPAARVNPSRRKSVGEDPAPYGAEAGAAPPPVRPGQPGGGAASPAAAKPSALLDARVVYCGDNLDQLSKLPPACVGLVYIDPSFNSNRN